MEGHEVLDEAGAEAIAVVIDGLQGRHVIVAGSVDGNWDRALPALKQRLEVVQEGVLAVRRVGDGLVAAKRPLCPDVVVEDPVVAASLLSSRPHFFLFATEAGADALGGLDLSGHLHVAWNWKL